MAYYATEGRKISTLPKIKNIAGKFVVQTENSYKLVDANTVKALMSGIKLIVNIPTGSSVAVSDGEQTITKTAANGTVEFALPYFATWTIVATLDSDTVQKTINVNEVREYEVSLRYEHIYGIRRDQNSSSPEWTRIDDSANFEAVPTIGTKVGHSDFDDCYPWSEMKRVTLSVDVNGIQKMVWIPEFWYKREVDAEGIETIQICDKAMTGFTKHPGSGVYVGAYEMSTGAKSINGATPQDRISLTDARTSVASTNGAGWHLYNVAIWSAIQMLFLVEYANNNSQAVLGLGATSSYIVTGGCDNVENLTGRPAGDESGVNIIYRGVEALWGNYAEFIDGLNINPNLRCYVCADPSNFQSDTSTNYTLLSYTGPGGVLPYITKTGYDPNCSWAMLPQTADGGSSTTYYCDQTYFTGGTWKAPLISGAGPSYGDACGIFFLYCHRTASDPDSGFTTRIAYYPSLDPDHHTIVYTDLGGES